MSGAPKDDRPPMVAAMQRAHQVTSISLEMALPAGLGYWLDQRWGTEPWLVIVGALLGFGLMMLHIVAIARKPRKSGRDPSA